MPLCNLIDCKLIYLPQLLCKWTKFIFPEDFLEYFWPPSSDFSRYILSCFRCFWYFLNFTRPFVCALDLRIFFFSFLLFRKCFHFLFLSFEWKLSIFDLKKKKRRDWFLCLLKQITNILFRNILPFFFSFYSAVHKLSFVILLILNDLEK